MALASYSELVTAITEYLAREEDATLIARIPTFIVMTEAKLNRQLRSVEMEKRAYAAVNMADTEPEFISLPMDFQTMRRVRLSSVDGKPQLSFIPGPEMNEMRTYSANTSDTPRYFTIFGTEMELFPTPSQSVTIEMIYRATIPALSASIPTNWVLQNAPDAYLYGALLETAPYIKEDARLQVWGAGFTSAVEGLNQLSIDATYGAGPLQVRANGYTP